MSGKTVSIGAKPTAKAVAADAWVDRRVPASAPAPEKVKRLTIDIPEAMHRAIKAQCAARGTKMSDELRELLVEKYGKAPQAKE